MNPMKQHTADSDEYIVTPGMFERAAGKSGRDLTEQERRARELVESIERDLFGSRTTAVYESNEDSSKTPVAEPEDDSSVGEVTVDETPAAEKSGHTAYDELEEHTIVEPEVEPECASEEEDDEFRFLLDMDYEDELGNSVGFERIRAYHEGKINGRSVPRGMKHAEFEAQIQEHTFHAEYREQRKSKIFRLVFSLCMLILILLYERAGLMARTFGGILDGTQYPVAYVLIGVQLLLLEAAFFAKPLWEGFLRLVRFSPIDHSFTSVLVIGTFVYHYILLLVPSEGEAPALYLSPAAFSLFLLAAAEFLNWYREFLAYTIVASRHQKYALVPRVSVGGERDRARVRMDRIELREKEYYVRPVEFVRNYFANTEQRIDHHRNLGGHMLMLLAIGAALGLVSFVGSSDIALTFRTVFATVLLASPCASLLFVSVPMFFSAAIRQRGKSAMIGERPVAECADPATIVLPDSEVFAAMEHDQLHLENGCDIHAVTALTNALLTQIGSPLAAAFSVDDSSRIEPERVHLTEIDDTGVSAQLDEDGPTIVFGTVPFVRGKGIAVRGLAADIPAHVYKRLYAVAVDGKTAAVFLVRYQLKRHIPALLREMKRVGVPMALRTLDPCVRADIMKQILGPYDLHMDVIKPSMREIDVATNRVDATVVALDSYCEVARAYAACRLVRRASLFGKWMQAISLVLGAALAAVLAVSGIAPSALIVTLWLVAWCTLYTLISYSLLERNEEKETQRKPKKRST